jgi:hypothetical protein
MNAWIENRRRAVAREQAPRAEVVEPAIDGTVATLRLYDPIDSWGEWWGDCRPRSSPRCSTPSPPT